MWPEHLQRCPAFSDAAVGAGGWSRRSFRGEWKVRTVGNSTDICMFHVGF